MSDIRDTREDRGDEAAPLLPSPREAEAGPGGTAPVKDAWQRGFLAATAASVVLGGLVLILLVASVIVMSGRPDNYYPPFDLYYYFAATAGFSIIAILHSATNLFGTRDGVPPPQGLAGILVDIFAGLFFLFQSLYSMQQLLYRRDSCLPNRPAPDPRCADWRRRAEPLFWTYLFVTFLFGY
ncbi:hypothetical protein VTK73DRAFT_4215 [Phialemonium thermophilum]|uniref:MARVEL domain-containing protein n=1 Tax=Phialemonium thermophilum TaxID=223376 RepID=A0ABR3VAL4_9PEZI